jgi:hypothetical protein
MVFMFASKGIEKLLITRTKGVDYIWQRVVTLKRFVFLRSFCYLLISKYKNVGGWGATTFLS